MLQDDFKLPNYKLNDGQMSPNGEWKLIYDGYGEVFTGPIPKGIGTRTGNCMHLRPQKNDRATSACLLMSTAKFKNFDLTLYMNTLQQLKTNPENWEVGWIMFRYNAGPLPNGQRDKHHHYQTHVNKNGIVEIGKKDFELIPNGLKTPDGVRHENTPQEQQQFLTTKNKIDFKLKQWYKIRLKMEDFNIRLWIDDKQIYDITDDGSIGSDRWNRPLGYKPSSYMTEGSVALYTEDAYVLFDNIVVK